MKYPYGASLLLILALITVSSASLQANAEPLSKAFANSMYQNMTTELPTKLSMGLAPLSSIKTQCIHQAIPCKTEKNMLKASIAKKAALCGIHCAQYGILLWGGLGISMPTHGLAMATYIKAFNGINEKIDTALKKLRKQEVNAYRKWETYSESLNDREDKGGLKRTPKEIETFQDRYAAFTTSTKNVHTYVKESEGTHILAPILASGIAVGAYVAANWIKDRYLS